MICDIKNKLNTYTFKDLVSILDEKCGLGKMEQLFATNWFNLFATLWINFRSLPFSQAIRLPIWCYGRPRFLGLSGGMIIEGKVSCGMISINRVLPGAPSNMDVQTEILNNGLIVFKGKLHIGTGNKIVVGRRAKLKIGANAKIADMCNIGCFERIEIGDTTRIAHRCQIFDSNYHYVMNVERGEIPNYKRPVTIGNRCWICNSSSILCGSGMPDCTVVSSNSLVNKNFSHMPSGSLLGGIPAKVIANGVKRVYNKDIEIELEEFYRDNPDGVYRVTNITEL